MRGRHVFTSSFQLVFQTIADKINFCNTSPHNIPPHVPYIILQTQMTNKTIKLSFNINNST